MTAIWDKVLNIGEEWWTTNQDIQFKGSKSMVYSVTNFFLHTTADMKTTLPHLPIPQRIWSKIQTRLCTVEYPFRLKNWKLSIFNFKPITITHQAKIHSSISLNSWVKIVDLSWPNSVSQSISGGVITVACFHVSGRIHKFNKLLKMFVSFSVIRTIVWEFSWVPRQMGMLYWLDLPCSCSTCLLSIWGTVEKIEKKIVSSVLPPGIWKIDIAVSELFLPLPHRGR